MCREGKMELWFNRLNIVLALTVFGLFIFNQEANDVFDENGVIKKAQNLNNE